MSERYSRHEGLFGAEGQAMLAATRVAIVGLGGLGSHVAQQLAYLGVRGFSLVDFDIVTESSLNRLVGATEDDIVAETKKVSVAERLIKTIQRTAQVDPVDGRVLDDAAERAVAKADVVFGALDRDLHRLELNDLCARYAKPYVDLASDVLHEDGAVIYGGRVVYCDGSRCLVCLRGVLDHRQIAFDRMDPGMREVDRRIYGVDRDALATVGPSVVSVNGVVASLGVTEFMVATTGMRPPRAQLTYRGDLGAVRPSTDEPAPDCYYCHHLWGSASSRS